MTVRALHPRPAACHAGAPRRRAPTPFETRVYDAVCRIPRGRVSTYGRVSAHLGCRSAQAVGQALRRNPFAPGVPCHRVIAADLSLGGFSGRRSGARLRAKAALLAAEGLLFRNGRLADPGRLYDFRGTRRRAVR